LVLVARDGLPFSSGFRSIFPSCDNDSLACINPLFNAQFTLAAAAAFA